MIYELRTYYVAPGRLADLHARLRDDVPPLFARHALRCIGRWSVASGPGTPQFVYLMEHESYAARESCWASLYADPQWLDIRERSNGDSEMVERYDLSFMKLAAGWSPVPDGERRGIGGLHERISQQVAIGQGGELAAFMNQVWLPCWRQAGATVMGAFDMASGADLPRQVIFLAWPDAAARHAGWQRVERDGLLAARLREQRARLGVPLIGQVDACLLEPADYALPAHPWALGRG